MKKLKLGGVTVVLLIAMTSCGHTICEAYGGQADFTKYKAEQTQKIELTQELTETTNR